MNKLLARAAEPSTHAGLAALSQALKFFAPQWGAVFDAATGLFAALAVAMKEKGNA